MSVLLADFGYLCITRVGDAGYAAALGWAHEIIR